jgi:hypothetical protein
MKGFVRPDAIILPEGANIPSPNVIVPPPNRFTHLAKGELPYSFRGTHGDAEPDGTLTAGTRVVLLRQDNGHCWVVDERGLYVEVDCEGLSTLQRPS